jgi:tetratricopeptide (TPR) repeat protein
MKLLWALFVSASIACRFEPATVTRLSGGVPVTGRYVPPEAYAAYSRGAVFEARGELSAALEAYQQALQEDADAPEILSRIGAVHCRLSKRPQDGWAHAARQAFDRALAVNASSAPAWLESARCARLRGNREEALSAALRAAILDPRSEYAALLVVDVAEESGRLDLARTWLDSLVVDPPVSRAIWLKLAEFAARNRDTGRALRARAALTALGHAGPPEFVLDESLTHDDLDRARHAAVELRLPPGRLALRAASAGALPIARAQSELVLAADPDDSDAWAAALLVSSLEREPLRLRETLINAPSDPTPPSPEAISALNEVIERLAGPEAAASFREAVAR